MSRPPVGLVRFDHRVLTSAQQGVYAPSQNLASGHSVLCSHAGLLLARLPFLTRVAQGPSPSARAAMPHAGVTLEAPAESGAFR